MSESKRNRKAPKARLKRLSKTAVDSRRRVKTAFLVVIVCGLLVSVLVFVVVGNTRTGEDSTVLTAGENFSLNARKGDFIQPTSLKELLDLSENDLPKVYLAVMNLLCAEGLPGTEKLNVTECSALLDKWAAQIKSETDRHLYRFRQAPHEYENSEGFFRMLMLNTVLQQDFGVHYNLERMREIDFSNSKDLFIHGMINDPNGGTCASMPVLVTAVARRLGYPVRIVTAKAHLFCRWDAPGDRINLEVSGRGLNIYPDKYYTIWPLQATDAEIKANRFLISLSPKEELANFLESRGHCLVGNNRLQEAEAVFAKASVLCPDMGRYKAFLTDVRKRQQMAANIGWQRIDPQRVNRVVNPIDNWDVPEHMRHWDERYLSRTSIPDPNPYANIQSSAVNYFGNPTVGVPQQPQNLYMQNSPLQQPPTVQEMP
ncbi:MAG TPA: transglutaminase family protein [Candidatus Sumerlaeota bacterium]|nr:transglutaminase family protein [Candidatus Sumerlaeota bacterium]HPS02779.1 transglutaminase family protein [Candidatus Sumerlaeota bacterium]